MLGSEKVGKTNAEKLKELRELQLTNAKNGYYGEAAKAYQERKYERAINDPLQKSRSDIYLDRAMANAKEQSNNQVWDEETLRLNKLKNDRQKLLSYMTAEQKYKYNQTEQNARDSYVKAIRDELNQKLGLDYAEDILSEEDTGNRFAKTTALATASGLDMFKSGMKSAGNVIKDLATGKDEGTKTTRSANEYAFGAVRPDVGTGTGVVMDTMQSIGNMVPSIALGMATGGLGVPLSGAIGSAAMGIASGGNAYDEAVNEGASVKRAATYGALNGAKEVLLQQLIGALPGINKADSLARKVIGNMGDNVATKILGDSTLKNALVNVIGNALSEGTEEAAQELIETFLGNVVLGKDESYSLKDAAYSGLLGGITGGAFPAVGAAARGVSKANVNVNTNANSNINDVNNNVDTVNNSVNEVNNNTDTITNNQNVGNINDFNVNTENILEEESEPIKDSLKNTLRMVNRNAENNQQIYREIMTNNGYGDLVRRMDGIANRLGNEVQFYSSDTKEDGYNLDGKIYLNINNLKDSADAEWKVFKHELTHSLEGTKAYGKLLSSKEGAELFYDFLRNKGYVSTDEEGVTKLRPDVLREEIRERYARNGVNLTAEEVENEVAAKFIEESDILTDEKVIEKLAKGDRNFAQRVLDWIKDTLAKIGSDYETNRLRKAERMYENAIRQAGKGQFEYEKSNVRQESISRTTNNEPVVVIDEDILDGVPKNEWEKKVKEVLKEKYSDGIQAGNNVIGLNSKSRNEYVSSKETQALYRKNKTVYADKMRTSNNLDEVVTANRNYVNEGLKHPRKDNITDFGRAEVKIRVGNNDYNADVVVGTTKNGKMQFYDVVNIKPASFDIKKTSESPYRYSQINDLAIVDSLADNNISQTADNVKKKFDFSEPVEETKNLVALHNLTEEKLHKALDLGGFPMPSIAVTKADIPHTNFGGITLVMNKSTIDPEANSKNTVYSADAWTPTFPEVEYEANEDVRSKISDKYYKLAKEIGYDAVRPLYNYVNDAERQLQRKGGEQGIVDSLKDDTDMMNVFLADEGKYIKPVEKTTTDRLSNDDIELYEYVADKLGKETIEKVNELSMGNKVKWKKEHIPEVETIYKGYLKDILGFDDTMVTNLFESPNFDKRMMTKTLNGTFGYIKNGPETTKTEYDSTATKEAIRKATDRTEYEAWLEELFGGLEKGTGIYNGKDIFNPRGDRRSFSETHYDVTLENIAKAMSEQNNGNTKNVSGFNGIKSLRAGTAERFNSIEDMHARETRLKHLTESEAESINEALSDRLSGIINRLYNTKSHSEHDNEFIIKDSIGEILVEIADSGKWTNDNIKKTLKRYGYGTSNEITENIKSLLNDVAQMPVNIFEAKPERAVKFDEVLAAVVPDDTDTEFVNRLKENGLNVITYERDNETSRINAVNSVDGAKFSIPEDAELNKKEENSLKRASNTLLNGFMEVTGAKGFEVDKKVFKDTINNFAKESVEAGRVDRTEANRLFNAMYNEAFTQEYNVYDEYRPIMEQIKATKLYGGGLGSEEGTLRREYFNKIRLVTDPTATKIDSFYKELSDNHPELFDGDVTDIGDQVRALGDFVDKATAKQVKLTEIASNAQEVYNETKRAFDEKLNKFEKEIKNVKRSKETRGQAEALKESISDTAQKVMTDKEYRDSFYKEKAKNQREYNKIKSQETLSLKDMQALKALSDGIVTIDQLESRGDNFNVDGVKRIYDAYEKKNAYDKVQEFIKQESKSRYRALAEAMTQGSDGWEDKKAGRLYHRETMERNIEDITAKANGEKKGKKVKGNRKNEEAKKINDTYFKPVHQNEANSTRMKNEYVKRIKTMDLETVPKYTVSISNERTGMPQQVRVSESGLVQLYGEKLIDKETLSRVGADVEKVTNAVKEFREIYNELLDRANEVLVKNGYDEVEYRKDYFPHFTEDRADTVLKKIGAYFGIETTNELPTDIAGITDTFRPGKKWVGNFLAREGRTTDYDALKGFDRYINGVADVIWHTDDIQRLRAFETEIRYKYSDQGTKERINEIRANDVLTEEEKKNQISAILDAKDGRSHLSNFAQELRNYTDNLAGKKSRFDRDMEAKIGRSAYSIFKKLEGRVSANMVALNPGSWLTNFIPITQVSSITGIGSLLNATTDTIANTLKKNSDFAERSDFLTNRRGSEEVYERGGFLGKTDKAADILTKPFEVIDNFSAEVVTRALYYDAVKKGMTETEAMDYANDLAARVMADRSKGAQPTMFNETNPITKLYTMFQTEVNNQYSFMFKDVPAEVGKEGKKALAGALFKMFIGAFLYNKLYEPLVGRKAAFDPVDIIATLIGDITDEDKDMWDVIYNTGNNVLDELPFVSSFTGGGRIPVSSALPDFANLGEAVFSDDISAKKRAETITKELANPILYLAPTIGGGQIKKAAEGIKTVAKGGEYTYDKEGNEKLKYAVEDPTVLKYIQATLFGKSSLKEAQDYYNSGSSILSVKQTQNYHKAVEAGINFEQYKAALNSVKGLESDKDSNGKTIALSLAKKKKAAVDEAVSGYNLTKKQKEVLYDACSISESVW